METIALLDEFMNPFAYISKIINKDLYIAAAYTHKIKQI